MARPLRIAFPDALYHVIARGNSGLKRSSLCEMLRSGPFVFIEFGTFFVDSFDYSPLQGQRIVLTLSIISNYSEKRAPRHKSVDFNFAETAFFQSCFNIIQRRKGRKSFQGTVHHIQICRTDVPAFAMKAHCHSQHTHR